MRPGDLTECHKCLRATGAAQNFPVQFLVDFPLVTIALFPSGPQRSGDNSGQPGKDSAHRVPIRTTDVMASHACSNERIIMPVHPSRGGPGPCNAQRVSLTRKLHELLESSQYDAYRSELAHAEVDGELSEFYALSYQAILAMAERSEFARDYLEMAEAAAASPYELVVVAENWTTYDLLEDTPRAAIERCLATLNHLDQNEHLWRDLLMAVCRLGDIESIQRTLRSLTEHGYSPRLARSSVSPPVTGEYS
jgi:hypothetical protein